MKENMPLASFLSFYARKIQIIRENVKHSQTERVKEAINKQILLRTFRN